MNARVGDIAEQIRGVSYSKNDAESSPREGYLPILRANNITDDGLQTDDLVFVPHTCVSQKQRLQRGDVVIAASSGSLDVVGKAAPVQNVFDGAFGAFCKVLRPRSPEVDARYFAHFFRTPSYRRTISQLAAGANINNLKNEHLDELHIPLPPLAEQRRIAAILDKADALRRKRKRALELLDTLTQSIFLDMFGDPETNAKRWPLRPIKEICRVVTGNTPSRSNPTFYGSAIEWIKSDNIDSVEMSVSTAEEWLSGEGKSIGRIAPAGSTLVTCIAGSPSSIGNAAMTNREVAFNQQINALIPIDVEPRFLVSQIRVGKRLVQNASTGGMKGLVSKSRLEEVRLIYPPRQLQEAFSERMSAAEKCRLNARIQHTSSVELFSTLQHRAFSGQL